MLLLSENWLCGLISRNLIRSTSSVGLQDLRANGSKEI